MKTIYLAATVSINGEDDMEKVFKTDITKGTTIDTTWMFTIASQIADRYTDAGQVCVNGVTVLAEPQSNAIAL